MISPCETLLRYDNPVLVSKATKTGQVLRPGSQESSLSGSVLGVKPETIKKLNNILPPREWTENSELWQQAVSSQPSTRLDVIDLQERLDRKLQQSRARDRDICPVRRELYIQCFDELIRQVTLDCPERGSLLSEVCNEFQLTIDSYKTLYDTSNAFAKMKALQAEEEKLVRQKRIGELEEEQIKLKRQLKEQEDKCEALQKQEMERQKAEEKQHAEDIKNLNQTNHQLKAQLEIITAQIKPPQFR